MQTLRPYHEAAVAAFLGNPLNTVDLGDAGTRQQEAAGRMPAPRGPGILPGASFQTTQSAKSTVLGISPQQWWRAEQVHGSSVACVPYAPQILAPDGLPVVPGVDGLVTNQPGVVLAIYVADCAAIWLADRVSGAIGLLHSGKQGTAGGILENALALMAQAFGTRPGDVTAVLSPCIRPPNYEVDFAAHIAGQAARAGIGGYYDSGANTGADISRFYSYRIEKGQTGRMMALAVRDCPP